MRRFYTLLLLFLTIFMVQHVHCQEKTPGEGGTVVTSLSGEVAPTIASFIKKIETDYEFVIDEESAKFLLDESRVDFFQTLPFTFAAHQKWPYLTQLTKLPYLLDRFFLLQTRTEFQSILHQPIDPPIELKSSAFHLSQLRKQLIEFQDEKQIIKYFTYCDINPRDQFIDWFEYLLCRGDFDRNGHVSDPNEFDVIENTVRLDFTNRLNNPTDPMVLDLIEKGIL